MFNCLSQRNDMSPFIGLGFKWVAETSDGYYEASFYSELLDQVAQYCRENNKPVPIVHRLYWQNNRNRCGYAAPEAIEEFVGDCELLSGRQRKSS